MQALSGRALGGDAGGATASLKAGGLICGRAVSLASVIVWGEFFGRLCFSIRVGNGVLCCCFCLFVADVVDGRLCCL